MDVSQIMKVVFDSHSKHKIETEIVSGPAYIHKKDAWARIEELVNDYMYRYMRNIQAYSLFNDAEVDCVKEVQETVVISIKEWGVDINIKNNTKEIMYMFSKLEIV